jgi:hypothetical protein
MRIGQSAAKARERLPNKLRRKLLMVVSDDMPPLSIHHVVKADTFACSRAATIFVRV